MICDRLRDGAITAIDRSPIMVERARKRNEQHLASGKATIHLGDLGQLGLPERSFTKVFAINVNLFWVRSPATELEIIGRLLRPAGALYLFYAPPSDAKGRAIAEQLSKAIPGAAVELGTNANAPMVAVIARL